MYDGLGKKPYMINEHTSTLQQARDRFEKQLLQQRLQSLEIERQKAIKEAEAETLDRQR